MFSKKGLYTIFLHYPDFPAFIAFHFQQKEPTLAPGMHRSKSKHELKLLEKIPENAEATVVLVGELSPTKPLKTTQTLLKKPHFLIVCRGC